jgi:Big-like domain-containing protein/cbb3-type cytochrome c oxidase subunit III
MKRALILIPLIVLAGCSHKQQGATAVKATAFGSAIVESSGGKQIAPAGTLLPQPVVVQVNDAQGNGVTDAAVDFSGPRGVVFDPPNGSTDSSGQLTTNVTLGNGAGRYELVATTYDKSHKRIDLKLQEIALDYQQVLGLRLNQHYCERCHNSESTPERVSNYDNLDVKPHAFTDGDYFNKMSDDDLTAIITHGGPALNKSPQMPPYGYTLGKSDIQALLAYIRAIADPSRPGRGLAYAQR